MAALFQATDPDRFDPCICPLSLHTTHVKLAMDPHTGRAWPTRDVWYPSPTLQLSLRTYISKIALSFFGLVRDCTSLYKARKLGKSQDNKPGRILRKLTHIFHDKFTQVKKAKKIKKCEKGYIILGLSTTSASTF
jgi:hypothetical protein